MQVALIAQDVHFTQYDASPLNINPANTGNYDGFWRFSGNFRTQWRSIGDPYNTTSLGFDKSGKRNGGNLSFGLYLLSDESGNTNLRSNRAYANFAVHLGKEKFKIHFGVQPGLIQKSIDLSKTTFPAQYDANSGFFNINFDNQETGLFETVSYADVNAGLALDAYGNQTHFNFGFSVQHLLQPNESFFRNNFDLPMRSTIHMKYSFPVTASVFLIPKLQYMMQSNASEAIAGLYVSKELYERPYEIKAIYMGLSGRLGVDRNTDAFNIILGTQFDRLDLGLSYDLNISDLREYSDLRGAFEVSFVYWSGKLDYKPTTVICERL